MYHQGSSEGLSPGAEWLFPFVTGSVKLTGLQVGVPGPARLRPCTDRLRPWVAPVSLPLDLGSSAGPAHGLLLGPHWGPEVPLASYF